MPMKFNPNEIVFEKIRYVEEYDPDTLKMIQVLRSIKDPSLTFSADGVTVEDANGAEIVTFYNAQTGEFAFTNALFSTDLLASQFGTEKVVASEEEKMSVPVSETLTIGADATVTLRYVPSGTKGAEIKYAQLINEQNDFGETYEVSATSDEKKFTIDAESKKLTFPEGTTGRVIVSYRTEMTEAVMVSKETDSMPPIRTLHVHCYFRDKCNQNIRYIGVIVIPRAQIDVTNVEIGLTPDGGHGATYRLQKPYCSDGSERLCDVIVYKD